MRLDSLGPGQLVGEEELSISQEAVEAYQGAVRGENATPLHPMLVPPMAVAALAMGAALRAAQLPPGAVHTGQELEFLAPVEPSTRLHCSVTVGQNSVRRGTRFLTLQFQVAREGQTLVQGLTSLIIQEEATRE